MMIAYVFQYQEINLLNPCLRYS